MGLVVIQSTCMYSVRIVSSKSVMVSSKSVMVTDPIYWASNVIYSDNENQFLYSFFF